MGDRGAPSVATSCRRRKSSAHLAQMLQKFGPIGTGRAGASWGLDTDKSKFFKMALSPTLQRVARRHRLQQEYRAAVQHATAGIATDGRVFTFDDIEMGRVRLVYNPETCQTEYRRWQRSKPRRRSRALCGARCRDGHECRRRVVQGRIRCPNHGGLSTGPKTAAGRARIAESNRRRARSKIVVSG